MKVAPGSPNVNWKTQFFVIRTHRTDSGPSSRILQIAFALFREDEVKWSGTTFLNKPDGVDWDSHWVRRSMEACGATEADLEAAPPFETIMDELLSGVMCPTWVGFDLPAEYRALSRERVAAEQRLGKSLRHLVPVPSLNVSVRGLCALLHPIEQWELEPMCRRLNVELLQSTLGRAIATGRILRALAHRLPADAGEMDRRVQVGNARAARPRGRMGAYDNAAARRRRGM
jgi:hypothetical protein